MQIVYRVSRMEEIKKIPDVIQVEYTDNQKVIYVNKEKQTVLWTIYHTILALELGALVIIEGIELLTR
jgi:hypothetical protein